MICYVVVDEFWVVGPLEFVTRCSSVGLASWRLTLRVR